MPFCAVRGKVSIHDTIIVAEIKRRAYKQSESKNGACCVASGDNNMALEHLTIHFVGTFCLCHLVYKHKMMDKTFWSETILSTKNSILG